MHLILISDFPQLLYSARKHPTKYYYFSTRIQFSTIYLLHKQNLNPINYFGHGINLKKNYKSLSIMCTCMQILDIYELTDFCN
jgi:hypothetical protein